jgi:hypothetical protein
MPMPPGPSGDKIADQLRRSAQLWAICAAHARLKVPRHLAKLRLAPPLAVEAGPAQFERPAAPRLGDNAAKSALDQCPQRNPFPRPISRTSRSSASVISTVVLAGPFDMA